MSVVLGTAGHIDHGKTSLVRALTGIDCDRLEEEKRRGITIELGFAWCDMPDGQRLGIVDVPGHERFVKNMVAGAAGIDFVMLVIAADEGVMPQTREHLEICSLLGIKHGLVALTKTDMVDAEWLELAREDVSTFLQGTFLEGAPIFPVSSATKEGLDELRAHVLERATKLAPQRGSNIFRLPADRVFTMKGHGTVITGTIVGGNVTVGDAAVFMPSGRETRVRSLQWHGAAAETAGPGQRCAVNVLGLDVEDITRGEVLSHTGTLFPASRWVVMLTCLSSAPRALRHRTEIHFHHGAREVSARLFFMDRDRLQPGESALTEIRCAEPLVGVFGDRCVVRAYSPLRTVAGGALLYPLERVWKKRDADYATHMAQLAALPALAEQGEEALTLAQLELAGTLGASFAELAVLTNADTRKLDKALQNLAGKGLAVCWDKEERRWIATTALQKLMEDCLTRAADFHKRDPLKPGMARGVLGQKLPPKLGHLVIERCLRAGTLVAEGEVLRLTAHKVELASDQQGLRQQLLDAHVREGLTPPNLKDVLEALGVDPKKAAPVLKLLTDEKLLVKVKDGLYYHGPVVEDIKAKVKLWFESHDDLDPAGLKEILDGISRKYLIALLEYMDRERFTIRVGDKRQWRGR